MPRIRLNVVIHILVAIVLSLVINFSYLLMPIITESGLGERSMNEVPAGEHTSGMLHLDRDMHGYIVCDCMQRDSVYISAWQVYSFKLQHGDHVTFTSREPREYDGGVATTPHKRLEEVYSVNGVKFEFDVIYDRPSRTVEFVWQILYYAAISFLMISILAKGVSSEHKGRWMVVRRIVLLLLITGLAIYLAPVMSFNHGEMKLDFFFRGNFRDNTYIIVLTKSLFCLVVTTLYSRIYTLMRQQQTIVVENERLKNENLSTRYNMLVGQINPHFFFNSLNSLAMLVRDGDSKRSLEYIDQLSYTFRYLSQNGANSNFVTLREEMQFAEAYCYLFKIRYADKLSFDFNIEEEYLDYKLPPISLQPLIGNTVKHNTISSKQLFKVRIFTEAGYLVVANDKRPMLEPNPGTGIGLSNLNTRYQLLLNREIEIIDNDKEFVVRLPLKEPKA